MTAGAVQMYTVHGELTADGRRIVLMAVGVADHWIATASRQLQLMTPLIKPTVPPGALSLPLTWAAVVQLAHTYGLAWRPGPRLTAWTAAAVVARTADLSGPLTVDLPAGLVPRPYQVAGAHMIAAVGSVLITDEPRTGKTITTVLGLLERSGPRQLGGLPVLVVAPASVVDPWVQAFAEWAPGWRTVAWRGTPARRRALAGTADVYVTGYDTARVDAPGGSYGDLAAKAPLRALAPASLVIDECHYLKNHHTARSHAVRRLAKGAGTVVALSGTPITHHPGDLWPTLVALEPAAWPSRERWVGRYCQSVPTADYGEAILGLDPHREPEYRATLMGATRRVARADVLDDLPPKVYSVRTVELPPAYRRAYDAMEHQMLAEMPDGGELSVMGVLAQLTRLAQLASAAADVAVTVEDGPDGLPREHQHVTLRLPSWKVNALLEVLAERPGDPTLSFTPSRQLALLAGAAAEKAGHRVGYIIGGQNPRERTAQREAFQAGQLDLLSCTTGAGGTGLTLTAAGTLVFLQRPWSLVESLQAEDRSEGIGASTARGTEIVDIVAADTIDTRVRAVLRERAGQLADLVQDPRIVAELLGGASVHPLKRQKAS
jgi:SNF2 family DNA or RNA helicase